mgnify:FL=1
MMTSFCWLLLGAFASFIVARLCRSAKVYISLLLILLLGYVVGTGVKRVVTTTQTTPAKTFAFTASHPTAQCSFTDFSATVNDADIVLGQDTKEVGTVKTNVLGSLHVLRNVEIENDS